MDFKIYFLTTLLIVLISILDQSTALHCYWCNSRDDNNCEKTKNGTHLVNCDDKVATHKPPGGKFTLCRKMVVSLPDSQSRTIRTCGYEEYKNPCYYTATRDVKSTVCQCFEDGCNSAPSTNAAFALLFCPLIVSLLKR